jgi:hypothetical protein
LNWARIDYDNSLIIAYVYVRSRIVPFWELSNGKG